MKTLFPEEITADDRPFVCSRGHADGTVTLYYEGDELPELPVVEVSNIPQEVSMRQARLALHAANKLADVTALLAALPEPQKSAAQIEWEYATTVRRDWPLVVSLGAALGLDLDALFVAAAAIPA